MDTLAYETLVMALGLFPLEHRRLFLETVAQGNCPPEIRQQFEANGESVESFAATAQEMLNIIDGATHADV